MGKNETKNLKKICGQILISDNAEEFQFNCTLCIMIFKDFENFKSHVKKNHKEKNSQLQYSDSSNNIKNWSNFKLEVETLKDIDENNLIIKSEQEDDDKDDTMLFETIVIDENNSDCVEKIDINDLIKIDKIPKKYICTKCNSEFSTEKILNQHKNFCKLVLSNISTLSSKNNLNTTQNIDDKTCRCCNKKFSAKVFRIRHEYMNMKNPKSVTSEKNNTCEECGKVFLVKRNLEQHMRTHTGEKPFQCHICAAAYSNKTNFQVHLRRHTGDKRYICQFCDKRFVASTERKIHERSHTGEKPYKCNDCGQCFAMCSYLKHHIERIHINIKKHKCEFCNKLFTTKKDAKKHAIIHKEKRYKCSMCNMVFAKSTTVKVHEKIHFEDRAYICKICGKGFKQSPGLYCHMKSHESQENEKNST